MEINLQKIGKKFRKHWVFRNIEYRFLSGKKYAIVGANGSGKSTLLQIISGMVIPSEGMVTYAASGNKIETENLYRNISVAAPYMTLFEQLSLREQVELHIKFKRISGMKSVDEIIEKLKLTNHQNNLVEDFSSGMKQRLKLGLALMSESSLILLDEPFTNLDEQGRKWYHNMINEFIQEKTVIVCSNKYEEEYNFCTEVLSL